MNKISTGEAEYRALLPVDKAALQAAAAPGGVPASSLDPELLLRLYRAGTVYLDVPVAPGDHISIPPLEGFVSNVTSEAGENGRGDPLEKLLYAAFVAASGRASVAQLASILSVDLARLQQALGVACRLGFASKGTLERGWGKGAGSCAFPFL